MHENYSIGLLQTSTLLPEMGILLEINPVSSNIVSPNIWCPPFEIGSSSEDFLYAGAI